MDAAGNQQKPKGRKPGCAMIGCGSIITIIILGAIINALSGGGSGNHTTQQRTVSAGPSATMVCHKWGSTLQSAGGGAIVAKYECRGDPGGPYSIDATIRDAAWTSLDYDQRLQLAKTLWEGCVRSAQLNSNPDACHVYLYGEAGESLGGSSSFAGSIINVNKD